MPVALAVFARETTDTLVGLGDTHGWHALFAFADALRPGTSEAIAELRRGTELMMSLSGST